MKLAQLQWRKRFLTPDLIGIYLIAVAITFIPLVTGDEYLLHVCALFGIYCILLAGFNLCAGVTGLISFGHGALYALGAYTCVLLTTLAGWPWVVSAIAGIIVALLGGVFFAFTAYRVRAFYLGLVTLAGGWIIYKVLWNWIDFTGGQPGIPVPVATIGGYELWETTFIYIIAAFLVFSSVVVRNIMLSRSGRAFKSICETETIAAAMGVDVPRYKFMAFVISAFFAGLAGIFYAYFILFVDPSIASLHSSFSFVIILVIGGWALLFGPVVGAAVYIVLPAYFGFLEQYWAFIWAFVIMVILLVAPKGIWGSGSKLLSPWLRSKIPERTDISTGIVWERSTQPESKPTLLEIRNLTKRFGGLVAVDNAGLVTKQGEIHALIGPNGSGKTTLINVITGFYSPDGGEIMFNGKRIDGLPPHEIVRLGIARTFQGAMVCEGMSTLDNVRLGQHSITRAGIFGSAFASGSARHEAKQFEQLAYSLLNYVGLADKASLDAEKLTDAERRVIGIVRALASDPKILILDEPVAGLTHAEVQAVTEKLQVLRDQGLGILLIEHHMEAVMSIADTISVLNFGVKIAEGTPEEIRNNEEVIAAYLGKGGRII